MIFKPFKKQKEFLKDKHRIRCLFAAKRGGKSEACYIDTIIKADQQPGYVDNEKDPYLMAILAPTQDMLTKLVWPKFRSFADHMCKRFVQKPDIFEFENGSIVYGISAEKINRMEGLKLYHVHMTEAFQMKEVALLESLARTMDTKGSIVIDGSLGPQLINPKQHWLYRTFKDNHVPDSKIWEWSTLDNPFVDPEEIQRQKEFLDPVTFRSMYEINWDTMPTNAVYSDFSDFNVDNVHYNPSLPVTVCVDWGWAHPMAVGFFQHNPHTNTVTMIDEIFGSKIQLDDLYTKIINKPYKINDWICDIAGNQEREQTGRSNVQHFKQSYGVRFNFKKSAVTYGIPIVRSFIKDGKGRHRFIVDKKCVHTIDGMRQYRYHEKDGIIQNENPVKENDDCVDMVRYYFTYKHDPNKPGGPIQSFAR